MASTTPNHGLPYPQAADDAVPHTDIQKLAEAVDLELDQINPNQIVGVTAGQLLIANASGKVTGVAMTGDTTITPAGTVTVGNSKITTAKLADKAVTTAKIDDGAVNRNKLSGWLKTASIGVAGTNGTGTITWDTPFSSSGYTVTVSALRSQGSGIFAPRVGIATRTTTGITVQWEHGTAGFTIYAIAIGN